MKPVPPGIANVIEHINGRGRKTEGEKRADGSRKPRTGKNDSAKKRRKQNERVLHTVVKTHQFDAGDNLFHGMDSFERWHFPNCSTDGEILHPERKCRLPLFPFMPNKSGLPQSAVAGYIVNPENLRPLLCRLLAKEPRRRIRVAIGLRILRQ